MIAYEELLEKLRENADVSFREFNAKICVLSLDRTLGVRVPALRKISKEYAALGKDELDILCRFPDDLFEVTFVKCLAVAYAKLTFEELLEYLDIVVPRIDNWAICDCFTSTLKSLRKRREEFLFYIEKCVSDEREYVQRFAYVCLLDHYTIPEYFEKEFAFMERADCSKYYVHMAVAWLLAEILVKGYGEGVKFLRSSALPAKTLNKAIQKARESYRLTDEQKNYLKTLKK
ncbi:DNA alkylation repair protein [Candidatus Borkfalkia ceftriaxoniphila]|uniref:DNA alkylation repair protein n=1 Tax=Candidatus Borkfalkia ceftriaxoniphila TaxID=2508949 RepID=A0A4Q2KA97_9FIRM|nr:DNA alkylation repair protein [Candidatus Borkfalkia ceftriaxoniphila]RXZ60919.1 DNA alkylation repair protein [Candidatus Borkfalkia ceftriaxoniphila]